MSPDSCLRCNDLLKGDLYNLWQYYIRFANESLLNHDSSLPSGNGNQGWWCDLKRELRQCKLSLSIRVEASETSYLAIVILCCAGLCEPLFAQRNSWESEDGPGLPVRQLLSKMWMLSSWSRMPLLEVLGRSIKDIHCSFSMSSITKLTYPSTGADRHQLGQLEVLKF